MGYGMAYGVVIYLQKLNEQKGVNYKLVWCLFSIFRTAINHFGYP